MSYIAKATINIKDIYKRRQLRENIKQLGYEIFMPLLTNKEGYLVINQGSFTNVTIKYLPNTKHFIDCNHYANGDEEKAIELFLELATLTDDLQTTTYLRCIRSVPPYYHYGDIVKRDAVEILNNFEICQPISLATAFKNEKINLK